MREFSIRICGATGLCFDSLFALSNLVTRFFLIEIIAALYKFQKVYSLSRKPTAFRCD